uniref:Mitochondrial inner membrane protein Mpv17 n=1 Tax=Glossina pallidipes TaxID=7398 RepID=A0A1A9ZBA2_GLOPL
MNRCIVQRLREHLSNSLQCGAIMGIGDLLAQAFGNKATFEDVDRLRAIKYATIGLIVGPFLGVWYTFLEKHVPRKDSKFKRALKKTAYDQLLLAPILTLAVVPLVGIINRQSYDQIKYRLTVYYPQILRKNYEVWLIIQLINFSIFWEHSGGRSLFET